MKLFFRASPVIAAMMALTTHAQAQEAWQAVVTRITDGDTVSVQRWPLTAYGTGIEKIRIEGIDAPEICQAWGKEAKLALQKRLRNQVVTVTVHAIDKYNRTVAKLSLNGEDMGRWLVAEGLAWSYRFREDDGPYRDEQRAAQMAGRGLFSDPQAMLPRDFRKLYGSCYARWR